MRTLAFDGGMGASGDMLLGALVGLGADPAVLSPVEDALGVEYDVGRTVRNGIAATTVDVHYAPAEDGGGPPEEHATGHDHGAEDGHADGRHAHDHAREAHADEAPAEGHGPHRSYPEVVAVVESMTLPQAVREDALAVFERLGEAEAAVHGTDLASTHFHEVGADDAIADVVGVSLLLADLDVDRVVTTPLAAGGGEVAMSHGRYPVPPPAVVELAAGADWSLRGGPVEAELLTPTGAALLAHFAEGVERLPALRVERTGYGAGDREFDDHPNVLRALAGDGGEGTGLDREEVVVLETNLDDATPEVLGGLQETLQGAGARDVSVLPATMKKSRPGHLVKVVVRPADADRVARRLAEETGTLGVRETGARHRWVADRRFATATLRIDGGSHEVRVKVASDAEGTVYDVSGEYDQAAAVAAETGLAVRDVLRRAETAARRGGALDDVVVHLVSGERWAEFAGTDAYRHPSLDDEGFVHLTTVDRLVGVAQYNHDVEEDLQALVCDRAALADDLKYEEEPSGAFPHLYGELPTDAVREVVSVPHEDGRFSLPASLRE